MVFALKKKNKKSWRRFERSFETIRDALFDAHLSRSLFRRMNETNSHLSEQGVAKFSRITRYMVEEKQLLLIRIWGSYVFIENLEWNNRNSFEWREIDIDSLEIRNLKITNKFSILVRRAIRSATIKRWKNYLRRE